MAVQRQNVIALDGSAFFNRPGPAGHRRHLAPRRDLRSRPVRRRLAADELGADPGLSRPAVPFLASFSCLWCGAAARDPRARTTSRAGPSSAPTAWAGPARTRSCGSGCATRSPSGPPPASGAGGARRRGAGGRGAGRARGPDRAARPRRPAATSTRRWSPTTRRGPASTTTGTSAAAATATARSTTWPGAPTSTRPAAGSTSSGSAGGSSSWPRARAGGRRSSPAGASCGATTRPRRPSSSPASGSSRTACGPTSTSATRGPSRSSQADALFMGFWLSHVPRPRLGAFLALARRWLVPGGTLAFIDSRHDPSSSALDHRPGAGRDDRRADARRRADVHDPQGLLRAGRAGGRAPRRPASRRPPSRSTARFFLLGTARAGRAAPDGPRSGRGAGILAAMSPLAQRTIATVGSGVMAEAMIAGLLRGALVEPGQVVASHPRAERRTELERPVRDPDDRLQHRGRRRAPT